MVYHSVVLNVDSNSSDCIIDIPQKDQNSHQLLIKLVHHGNFYNISGYDPEITFYDPETCTVVLSSAVDILNDYRGHLSYIVGSRLVEHSGRYTVTLKLKKGTNVKLKCNFIVNVVSDPQDCDCDCACHNDTEVTISKKFYERMKRHLDNLLIHSSPSDRVVLDFLNENLETLVTTGSLNNINAIVDELLGSVISRLEEGTNNNSVKIEELSNTISQVSDALVWGSF